MIKAGLDTRDARGNELALAKRKRLRTGLLVATGATALSFGLEAEGKQARTET